LACDRVNGGNYWQESLDQGRIVSRGPTIAGQTRSAVRIVDDCEWQRPDTPVVMKDHRQITVSLANPRQPVIDWEIAWTAVQEVTVETTNHSLFALRAAADIPPSGGGQLVNAEGRTGEKATFGQPSAWCAFYGRRPDVVPDLIEGIALLDHPLNPWPRCPWFTRDYGFISPTPFNFRATPWRLEAGESVLLKYRIVLFAGTPDEARLADVHRAWIA
jgi:hypothetical protein